MLGYSLIGQLVIGLEDQQVVGPARQDPLGDCGLTAHGVQRHDAVLQCELVQQFRDSCDLLEISACRRIPNETSCPLVSQGDTDGNYRGSRGVTLIIRFRPLDG